MVDLKDIDMLQKLYVQNVPDEEPPPVDEIPIYNSRDSDVDSEAANEDENDNESESDEGW